MKNLDNEVWELLQDDRFMKWVHSPDEGAIAYWELWMEEHPDRVATLFKAREIARDLAYMEKPAEAEELSKAIWTGVLSQLGEDAGTQQRLDSSVQRRKDGSVQQRMDASVRQGVDGSEPQRTDGSVRQGEEVRFQGEQVTVQQSEEVRFRQEGEIPRIGRSRRSWYWMAACLAGLLLAGAGLTWHQPVSGDSVTKPQVASLLGKEGLQRVNRTEGNQEVYLVDGSRIVLQPGSSIRHAAFLQKDKREIYLEGNAFFEVAKESGRPFYVYTKDVVVRVLGTSFNVTTDRNNGNVTVLVRTGKVAVSKKINLQQEVVLESDQQALYQAGTRSLVQSARITPAERPVIPTVTAAILFNFEETPVVEIFKTLEKAYGIPLHYPEKTFSACVVTTSLTNETFEDKLKIICEAIGATYRIDPTGVFIEGRPCNK